MIADKQTEDYAERIAQSIRELEALNDLIGAGAVSNGDELKEALREAGEEALSAYDDLGGLEALDRHDYDPLRAYFEDVLEIRYYLKGSLGLGEPELHEVEALLSFGGPNTYAKVNESQEWVTVTVYWGGDKAERSLYAPGYAAWLWSLVEGSLS